ncbi:hypothetical protein BASA81_001006 [Batrachochytrium salamandrivorans]|nr:hypothetical protein BASA81_001006 [Batrachochytrium salamandrivorans]
MEFVQLAQRMAEMQQRIGQEFDSAAQPLVLRERMQFVQTRLVEIQQQQLQINQARVELAEALRKTRSLTEIGKALPEVRLEVQDFESSLSVAKLRCSSSSSAAVRS